MIEGWETCRFCGSFAKFSFPGEEAVVERQKSSLRMTVDIGEICFINKRSESLRERFNWKVPSDLQLKRLQSFSPTTVLTFTFVYIHTSLTRSQVYRTLLCTLEKIANDKEKCQLFALSYYKCTSIPFTQQKARCWQVPLDFFKFISSNMLFSSNNYLSLMV